MRRPPRPASTAMQRVMASWGAPVWADPVVREAWARAVGPAVARHAVADGLRGGTLTVRVDDPVWSEELSRAGADLVQRVNEALGAPRVRDLRFCVGRVPAVSARPPGPAAAPPVPADVIRAIDADLAALDDLELAAAIRNARVSQLRRRARRDG